MNILGIRHFLAEHRRKNPISFHMPGHKGAALYAEYGYTSFLEHLVDYDVTEIPGADNLFQAEGIIRDTASKYRSLYHVKKSYLLINGTSGGIIASILATVSPGKKLIMARNCHKSVFNALTLGHIQPVYAYPEVMEEYGISGPISPEEIQSLLEKEPDAEAVILPSPNYYGICSDIQKIADVVHQHGKVLIIDQAHGAHLKFFSGRPDFPRAAEDSGADIIINSIHKTLPSFTQSAVLNINSDRVDLHLIEDKLQAIESTSPSYILMTSLDIAADIIRENCGELIDRWYDGISELYEKLEAIPGLRIMSVPGLMDKTKINLDMSPLGIDGNALENLLNEKNIYPELTTGNILMCMSGIGNTREDYDALYEAIKEIAENSKGKKIEAQTDKVVSSSLWTKKRQLHQIPREKEYIPIDDAEGRICATSVIPYPPGIPFLCPGRSLMEKIFGSSRTFGRKKKKVIGVDEENRITVQK